MMADIAMVRAGMKRVARFFDMENGSPQMSQMSIRYGGKDGS